ncbi:MAG TPA: class I SAM-dependent methyltransferase [Vulgatibacter sp.]
MRCPRCGGGPLTAEGEKPLLAFGPVTCTACGTAYPVADGILDVSVGPEHQPPRKRSLAQRALETKTVARFYERGLRPALARFPLDGAGERFLFHALIAPAPGEAILDLSCGTGHLARDLAVRPGVGPVFGLDLSPAMLEEARHHLEETGAPIDLLRGDASTLPFRDASLGAVLDVAALHLYERPREVLGEISRVLAPGGRFVCATFLPERVRPLKDLERRAGIVRREEGELRRLCESAGLRDFERMVLHPWIVFRARKT